MTKNNKKNGKENAVELNVATILTKREKMKKVWKLRPRGRYNPKKLSLFGPKKTTIER